ncbi:hypothetical protein ACNF42_08155 [Cuniculiplasma sp. SKW3]
MIQKSIRYNKLKEIIGSISSKSVGIAVCRTVVSITSDCEVSKGNERSM